MKRSLLLVGLGAIAGYGLVRWQLARLFAEEPKYAVEERRGALEIRRYAPTVRAETTVDAPSWREALNTGFRRLAGYIFGKNAPRESIAMTAPVTAHERIAMTTPVTGAPAGASRWTVTFTMPEGRTLESLPRPDDPAVVLRSIPERRLAVLRYTGRFRSEVVAEKQRELLAAVGEAGLTPRGTPESAGYDPPTTLPFLRRNEVWVEVAP